MSDSPNRLRRWLLGRVPPNLKRRLKAWRADLRLARALLHDWRIYRRHSGLHHGDDQAVLEARILKSYHRLEKGLALAAPRPGFGPDAVSMLLRDLDQYISRHGADHVSRAGLNTIAAYLQFNEAAAWPMPEVKARHGALVERQQRAAAHSFGGTLQLSREQVLAQIASGHDGLSRSRHSVRQFADQPVDEAAIEFAVRCAQKAPSVCNRQAGKVYVARDKDLQRRLLQHQNGNRGFGEQADVVLIVAVRLASFLDVGERHQCWIDGGLFAMSLVQALHAQGLGTCCLNWSVERDRDRQLKTEAGLDDTLEIIMLIAVGHLPAQFRVAQSPRRPLDEVMVHLG